MAERLLRGVNSATTRIRIRTTCTGCRFKFTRLINTFNKERLSKAVVADSNHTTRINSRPRHEITNDSNNCSSSRPTTISSSTTTLPPISPIIQCTTIPPPLHRCCSILRRDRTTVQSRNRRAPPQRATLSNILPKIINPLTSIRCRTVTRT